MNEPKDGQKHSPLPWRESSDAITTEDGKWLIADSGDWGGQIKEADAKLIVRAVNSYWVAGEMAKLAATLSEDSTPNEKFWDAITDLNYFARKFEEINREQD